MRRAILICFVLLASAAVWWWTAKNSGNPGKSSRDQVAAQTRPKLDATARNDASRNSFDPAGIALDRIASASFQEVYDLLASRNSREIGALAGQLQDLSFGSRNGAKIDLFFKAWSQLSPQDALQGALSFQAGWARTRALEAVFDGADPKANVALVNSISELPDAALAPSLRRDLLEKGLSNWSRVDPAAAASFLEGTPNSVDPLVWREIAENWATQDPAAALQWVQKQNDAETAGDAMQGLIGGWWQKDPKAAADYAAAHVDSLAGQRTASVLANRMAEKNPAEAAQWVAQLPNDSARRMSEATLAAGWAANDPRAAGEWAAGLAAEDQEAVVGGIAMIWAQNDPQAAAEWINGLRGSVRDGAAASYSSAVARTDPEAALGWALSVSDTSLRNSTARHIASDWLARDPGGAAKWIQGSALPDADKRGFWE